MKNFMKSLVCTIVMMCTCVGAKAQDSENALGVNFGYMMGAEGVCNFGIGVKYDRFLSEGLRLELGGMYYFKGRASNSGDYPVAPATMEDDYKSRGKDCDWFDLNLNAHYLFNISDQFKMYPIFGFTGMIGKTSFKWEDKKIAESALPMIDSKNQAKINKSYSDNHLRFGVNLGAGAQYNVTDDFGITLEAKYKILKTFHNFNLALGCVVLF